MDRAQSNLFRQVKETYGEEYEKHLFEQYKLYVEMADRVSARRVLANSFFIGVHTALITAFTVLLKEHILPNNFIGYFPFLAVILLCYVWKVTVDSYRKLNSGKFKVIHEIEQHLPIAPYAIEWEKLGRGKDSNLYLPTTHIETWVPFCFGTLYLLLGAVLVLK